ncbi:MAG: EAL domain-containing protein [Gemmatimonadetes bacterium]|nr:EAL domain-containing protein [Gemmatimonadota bacterium]
MNELKTRKPARAASLRDSRGMPLTPLGALYIWCGNHQTRAKVSALLTAELVQHRVEEGECVVAELEWVMMRHIVMPLRRSLSHIEAKAVKALYKPDGGPLGTADFPKVKNYTQFSQMAESQWLSELLDEERFTSVLQTIVHADSPKKVFAREALLRGIGRDDSIIHPQYLFDAARGCGMLDRLELAARRAAVNRMVIDGVAENLFINVTPSAIEDPMASLNQTVDFIDEAGISHDRIVFEIVESDRVQDIGNMQRLLQSHRDAGFRVALDDVGAGYSSLNLLHLLRPDFIKLDMELVHGVTDDAYKALITRKILEIAGELEIQSIAEGVETDAELDWVREHGATYAQGFAIARPTTPTLHGRTPPGVM